MVVLYIGQLSQCVDYSPVYRQCSRLCVYINALSMRGSVWAIYQLTSPTHFTKIVNKLCNQSIFALINQ